MACWQPVYLNAVSRHKLTVRLFTFANRLAGPITRAVVGERKLGRVTMLSAQYKSGVSRWPVPGYVDKSHLSRVVHMTTSATQTASNAKTTNSKKGEFIL